METVRILLLGTMVHFCGVDIVNAKLFISVHVDSIMKCVLLLEFKTCLLVCLQTLDQDTRVGLTKLSDTLFDSIFVIDYYTKTDYYIVKMCE